MKIIKSFCVVIVGLCATTLLRAQDITAKTVKPVESSIPPPGNKPITAPDLKPETKIIPKGMTVDAVPVTPSPLNRDENKELPGREPKQIDDDPRPKIAPAKNLSEKNSASSTELTIPNTVLPKPIMTNMSSTITTTAPVIKDTKKPAPIPERQKQN